MENKLPNLKNIAYGLVVAVFSMTAYYVVSTKTMEEYGVVLGNTTTVTKTAKPTWGAAPTRVNVNSNGNGYSQEIGSATGQAARVSMTAKGTVPCQELNSIYTRYCGSSLPNDEVTPIPTVQRDKKLAPPASLDPGAER